VLDRWIIDNEPSPTYPIYTRANAGEVYPDPISPLAATLEFMAPGEAGWRDAYCRYSMRTEEFDLSRAEILGCFGGYLYLNMSLTRLFGVRMPGMTPEMVDFQYFGTMPGIPPYEERPGDVDEERSEALQGWLESTLGEDDLPRLRADRAEVDALVAARPDPASLTDRELIAHMRSFGPLFRRLFDEHITVSAASGIGAGIVAGVCQAIGEPDLTMRLVAGIGDVDSAAPANAMWDLSRLDPAGEEYAKGLAEFVERFGSRGPNEWELRSPTWGTDPSIAVVAIDRMRLVSDDRSPAAQRLAYETDADEQAARVVEALAGDDEALAQFQAGLRCARLYLSGRERSKTTIVKIVHELRLAARELGRRHAEAGHFDTIEQIFMLKDDELDELAEYPRAFGSIVREREMAYLELFELDPPFIVVGEVPPLSAWRRRDRDDSVQVGVGDTLTGIPGCPGRATGRARIVLDPSDPAGLEPGDVLVAPITDPAWTPLFVPAAAVVVDVGAQVSHAVIVSRELGIPCVVSVTDATRKIADGATIEVDGTAGTVMVVG
jgi:pyruvate,water dikinase